MINLALVRIDDRLIHGQVMTAWVKYTSANRIIIIDDLVAEDPFMTRILKMSAPPGIKVEVYDIEGAIEVLSKDLKKEEKIIILVKYPKTIQEIFDQGVKIKEVIVGGMGANVGRKKLYRNISASDEERQTFKALIEKGVEISIRIVPDDRPVSMEKFLK